MATHEPLCIRVLNLLTSLVWKDDKFNEKIVVDFNDHKKPSTKNVNTWNC